MVIVLVCVAPLSLADLVAWSLHLTCFRCPSLRLNRDQIFPDVELDPLHQNKQDHQQCDTCKLRIDILENKIKVRVHELAETAADLLDVGFQDSYQ